MKSASFVISTSSASGPLAMPSLHLFCLSTDNFAEMPRSRSGYRSRLCLRLTQSSSFPKTVALALSSGARGMKRSITSISLGGEEKTFRFPIVPPELIHRDMKRLREVVSDRIPTIILCDNTGQAERLDELLNEGRKGATTASLAIGVLHGGFIIPPWGMQLAGLRVL